jgi:parvulin-like peptidyl-prolyl isomerase
MAAWPGVALLATGWAVGEGAAPGKPGAEAAPQRGAVVATVGQEPIYAGEVQRLLHKAAGGKEVGPSALPVLQAQVLQEIVDRRLVLAHAGRIKIGPSEQEIDAALAQLKAGLESQRRSLDDFLKQQGIGPADLRRQIAWNLAWEKCLARYVTEDRVKAYFQAHHREFDGTEVSVAHILWKPQADAGQKAIPALVRQAEAIRREIVAGKLSFAEAARRYSTGPSAAVGGELGFIARQGAMVESFARAAFALEPGGVSEPVVTPFGVHLIRVNQVRPGSRQLSEVRKAVEEAMARELMERLAEGQRQYTPVEFTGAGPYFKPGTKELGAP